MADLDGILGSVCDHPGDRSHRLVFADCCSENGQDDRAEFVRLQLKLEDTPEYDPARFEIEERALDLLAEHRDEWLASLPAWAQREPITFRQGLPGEIRLPPGRFLTQGERLARSMPLVRLTLDGLPEKVAALAASPALERVPELELADVPLSSHQLRDFLRRFPGERLRHLGFGGNRVPLTRSEFLSCWPGLAGLASLSLRGLLTTDASLAALLASLNCGRLERLKVAGELPEGGRTVAAVARNKNLSGLRVLGLADIHADDAGVAALAEGGWHRLEHLALATGTTSPATVARLAAAPYFAELRALDLKSWSAETLLERWRPGQLTHLALDWGVSPEAIAAVCASDLAEGLTSFRLSTQENPVELAPLSRSACFTRLERLEVGTTLGRSELACEFLESPHFPALRELHLTECGLTTEAAQRLPRLAGLSRLRALSVRGVWGVGGAVLGGLASSPHLTGLRRLDLGWNHFGDAGLTALLQGNWVANLRELRLYCASLSPAGLQALAACPALTRLRLLELDHHAVTVAGAAALAASPHLDRLLQLRIGPKRPARGAVDRLRERFGGRLILFGPRGES
jgi:uncharacterized protein (TIGR02996 family)